MLSLTTFLMFGFVGGALSGYWQCVGELTEFQSHILELNSFALATFASGSPPDRAARALVRRWGLPLARATSDGYDAGVVKPSNNNFSPSLIESNSRASHTGGAASRTRSSSSTRAARSRDDSVMTV